MRASPSKLLPNPPLESPLQTAPPPRAYLKKKKVSCKPVLSVGVVSGLPCTSGHHFVASTLHVLVCCAAARFGNFHPMPPTPRHLAVLPPETCSGRLDQNTIPTPSRVPTCRFPVLSIVWYSAVVTELNRCFPPPRDSSTSCVLMF